MSQLSSFGLIVKIAYPKQPCVVARDWNKVDDTLSFVLLFDFSCEYMHFVDFRLISSYQFVPNTVDVLIMIT